MSESATHDDHHIITPATYIKVLLALMVLMAATIGAAYFHAFGNTFSLFLALFIAVCKMTLIILYFMHVKFSSSLTKLFVSGSIFFLIILFTLTLCDYLSREWWSPFVAAPY